MREIIFRGFRPDENGKETVKINGEVIKGEWIEGDIIQYTSGKVSIRNVESWMTYDVLSETVGQFTDLTDKDGKKIFEGDKIKSNKLKYKQYVDNATYEVYFNVFLCHFALATSDRKGYKKHGKCDCFSLTGRKSKEFEVIGTIFDEEDKL